MARFKPTAGQKEVIDVLAHILVMAELEKNVPGTKGMFQSYIDKTLTVRQKGIYDALQSRCKAVRKDIAKLMKQDEEQGI